MTMDAKGIAWVGNIYQKFENMCLEVEEMVLEDTVKYIEDQMQTVGESVKKIYSDVVQDLLPPSLCDLDEKVASGLPTEEYTDAGFCEKIFQDCEKITVTADAKETAEDSRINRDVDNDAVHDESGDDDALFKSVSGNFVYKNNLGSDENQRNDKMPASETVSKITLLESDICSTSQSCELSNDNQNHAVTVSKPDSAEVTRLASEAFCCNEIENASAEQASNVLMLVKSAEEKEMNMSYCSSTMLYEDTDGFSMLRTTKPDDWFHSTIVVSHPEIPEGWSLDATKIDTITDHGDKTMQQDDELQLEETCVMVTRDELQLVPKTRGNLETDKKKRRQPFSLSKKSGRKQEYEELAIWHGNKEKGRGDYCPTSVEDQKKLMLPDISEPEWELL